MWLDKFDILSGRIYVNVLQAFVSLLANVDVLPASVSLSAKNVLSASLSDLIFSLGEYHIRETLTIAALVVWYGLLDVLS